MSNGDYLRIKESKLEFKATELAKSLARHPGEAVNFFGFRLKVGGKDSESRQNFRLIELPKLLASFAAINSQPQPDSQNSGVSDNRRFVWILAKPAHPQATDAGDQQNDPEKTRNLRLQGDAKRHHFYALMPIKKGLGVLADSLIEIISDDATDRGTDDQKHSNAAKGSHEIFN